MDFTERHIEITVGGFHGSCDKAHTYGDQVLHLTIDNDPPFTYHLTMNDVHDLLTVIRATTRTDYTFDRLL